MSQRYGALLFVARSTLDSCLVAVVVMPAGRCPRAACAAHAVLSLLGCTGLCSAEPAALRAMQVLPADKAKHALSKAQDFPIDGFALRKYTGLCETYAFAGKGRDTSLTSWYAPSG